LLQSKALTVTATYQKDGNQLRLQVCLDSKVVDAYNGNPQTRFRAHLHTGECLDRVVLRASFALDCQCSRGASAPSAWRKSLA
jgi:hypothetical protein